MTTRRALLILAVLLAAFLRFWRLDTMPPGLYHDEAYNGLDALSLTQGVTFPQFYEGWELYAQEAHADRPPNETRFPIFFEGNYGREPLHVYLMALSVRMFGATPFAVRAVPAAAGVLAVITTYFAASVLVQEEGWQKKERGRERWFLVPGFAALALAILYPALHFSRFGIRAMLFVPVETLTVAFFWMGVNALERVRYQACLERSRTESGVGSERELEDRGRHIRDAASNSSRHPITPSLHHLTPSLYFTLAGLFLGLGIYTYAAARLFPLLFVVFIPLWLWHSKRWQRYWRYAALMAVVSIVTALPLLLFFWRYPYFFVFRIAYVSNKGTGTVDGRPYLTWMLNVGRVLRGLLWRGETHLRHNLPGRPYLDPIQLSFFATGLIAYFYRWNRLRPIFLGLWLGVMLLPSILSGDAPHFGRMTGAAPVIAILIGIGAAWLWERVRYQPITQSPGYQAIPSRFILSLPHSLTPSLILFTVYFLLFTLSTALTFRDYFVRYAHHPLVAADFYLPDWQLGQYAAAQPESATLYLTPTQEEMATIYFALADPARMQSYAGGRGLVPLGRANSETVYFFRTDGDNRALAELEAVLGRRLPTTELDGVLVANGRFSPEQLNDFQPGGQQWGGKIRLDRWRVEQKDDEVVVHFLWQAIGVMERPYTVFVHLVDTEGEIAAQLDRPPAGYTTIDWQPGELIYDFYPVSLPDDLPAGAYHIRIGFYESQALIPLGEPVRLTEVTLGQ